jgi:hypothetical protein
VQGVAHGNHVVYLYETMLYSESPLLKEIYCESHRWEPWAVRGRERRYGTYAFRNVLYVDRDDREALLGEIATALLHDPSYADSVRGRFDEASRALLRSLRCVRQGAHDRASVEELLTLTGRVLSSGVFKEVLEPDQALELLAGLMPVASIRTPLFALYQPSCLPHFLKFELKLLYFAARYAANGDAFWVRACIDQAAHLSKFQLEPTALHEPQAMRQKLREVWEANGASAKSLAAARANMLVRHREAVLAADRAEAEIIASLTSAGRYQLRTISAVRGLLAFIRFIGTFEELKHILTVDAAKTLARVMRKKRLALERTASEALLAALTSPQRHQG